MEKETVKMLATMNCIIYLITNIINKKVYVGQTMYTFNERYEGAGVGAERVKRTYEINNEKGNTHLYNAMCKYGVENFTVEIIHIAQSKEELNYFERFYELYYNARNPKYGYNKKPCGDSHVKYHRDDEYYLERIRKTYSKKTEERVRVFLNYRKRHDLYDGNECYMLMNEKIIYDGVRYNGLLSIPYKITKTQSVKKLYDMNYQIVPRDRSTLTEKQKQAMDKRKMKKMAKDRIISTYEPYYEEDGSITDENWEIVKPIVIDILKTEFNELYEELFELYGGDYDWMLRVCVW